MNSSYSWSLWENLSNRLRASCSLRALTCHQRHDPAALPLNTAVPQLEIDIHFHRIFRMFSHTYNESLDGLTPRLDAKLAPERASYKSSLARFVSSSEPSRLALVRQLLTEVPLLDWLQIIDTTEFDSMLADFAQKISSSAYDEAREASTGIAPGHKLVFTAEIHSTIDMIPNYPLFVPEPPEQETQVLSAIGEKEWRSDTSSGGGGSSVCTVCLDDFVSGERVATLQCFHHFHRDCIVKWLLLPRRIKSCPVCRMPVD